MNHERQLKGIAEGPACCKTTLVVAGKYRCAQDGHKLKQIERG